MTHYFFDPKTNTLHGPIDRMPPVWDYGFPPDGPSDSQLTSAEADFDDAWKSFNAYLQTVPSHPHTFTGKRRVVPEDKITWELQWLVGDVWHETNKEGFDAMKPTHRRRVATPKITGEPSIPVHIVDDMKLDSYYDGFNDGAKITGEPATQAPGYTSSSGEDDDYPGYQCGLSEFEWQMEKVIDEIRSKETTLECMAPLVKFLRSQQPPLTAQPDRTHRYEYSNISEYLECYGDYVLRGTWNLPTDFIAVNPPPSPTAQQGEKEEARKQEIMQSAMALVRAGYTHAVLEIADLVKDKNIDLPVELSDKLLDMLNEDSKKQFNALLFEKELSAIDPAQQPHSPALQGELIDALIYTITEANANGDQYGEIKSKVAALLSPAQPLTTDEEAAESLCPFQIPALITAYKTGFSNGCTHVRSQQQGDGGKSLTK